MSILSRVKGLMARRDAKGCPECEGQRYGHIRTYMHDPSDAEPVQVSLGGGEMAPEGDYHCPKCGRLIESLGLHLHVVRSDDADQNADSSNV
ncbi:hypothetical protein KKD52_10190 [Myxococcota bacterium]|nr:hypothetical protein [Myxococcota bacterium]